MRRIASAVVLCLLVFLTPARSAEQPASATLTGFTAESTRSEREWEEKFKQIPSPDNMRESMRRLSARPHHVGSPYDKDNAEWILARFKEYGWEAQIETFDVLFPTPKTRLVELVAPTRFTAKLEEPALANDPTSNQKSEQLPTYNAYSHDGDVTAPLVFVNYGLPADYEKLDRLGISVKGAIVIAKYGNSWRGIKPKVAAEHGAIGCLIYSDPKDDGYAVDQTFPDGPMRPKDGVQRGSVMDMPLYPGDPLTPGVGAKPDTKRLKLEDSQSITKIPVLPISYADAQPLLAALGGPVAPEEWRGGLPITYHIGAGPAKVHLVVKSNWDIKKVYDVVARMPGSSAPDQWIVRGNHHDAWVNGAEDPESGQMALLEEARALGELRKQGWKPKRTIIYCAWDGEEPMLLGSTEWGEFHAEELKQHGAIYINSDGNGRGYLGASGSHSLEHLVNEVAKDVRDPEAKVSAWKRLQATTIANAKSADDRSEARTRGDLRIGALGSGSDYTVFLDHLGMATLDIGYGGEDDGGIYHSIYDDFYWYTHFSDTTFVYGRALSQTIGLAVMRFADADILPYEFSGLADTARKYSKQLQTLLKNKQDEVQEQNQQLQDGVFAAVNDPRRPQVAPKTEAVPPHINFAPLENALDALTRSADRYKKALSGAQERGVAEASMTAINERLIQAERQLTNNDGLKRRPWFKHLLYAPGWYTGYGAKTMPGIREAIEEKRYADAEAEVQRVAKALADEASWIDTTAGELEKATATQK